MQQRNKNVNPFSLYYKIDVLFSFSWSPRWVGTWYCSTSLTARLLFTNSSHSDIVRSNPNGRDRKHARKKSISREGRTITIPDPKHDIRDRIYPISGIVATWSPIIPPSTLLLPFSQRGCCLEENFRPQTNSPHRDKNHILLFYVAMHSIKSLFKPQQEGEMGQTFRSHQCPRLRGSENAWTPILSMGITQLSYPKPPPPFYFLKGLTHISFWCQYKLTDSRPHNVKSMTFVWSQNQRNVEHCQYLDGWLLENTMCKLEYGGGAIDYNAE